MDIIFWNINRQSQNSPEKKNYYFALVLEALIDRFRECELAFFCEVYQDFEFTPRGREVDVSKQGAKNRKSIQLTSKQLGYGSLTIETPRRIFDNDLEIVGTPRRDSKRNVVKSSGNSIFIYHANSGDHEKGGLLTTLAILKYCMNGAPSILIGDFNTEPLLLYKILLEQLPVEYDNIIGDDSATGKFTIRCNAKQGGGAFFIIIAFGEPTRRRATLDFAVSVGYADLDVMTYSEASNLYDEWEPFDHYPIVARFG